MLRHLLHCVCTEACVTYLRRLCVLSIYARLHDALAHAAALHQHNFAFGEGPRSTWETSLKWSLARRDHGYHRITSYVHDHLSACARSLTLFATQCPALLAFAKRAHIPCISGPPKKAGISLHRRPTRHPPSLGCDVLVYARYMV